MNSRHCKGIIAARALKEQLLKEDNNNYLCLFVEAAGGQSFISEESDWSGNWKGSKYGFFNLYESIKYDTKEEKLLAKQKLEAIAAKI